MRVGRTTYDVGCPLLSRQCACGKYFGERLDKRAKASAKAVVGLPNRFHDALEDPKLTAAVRGANTWLRKGTLFLHGEHGTGKSFAAAYALYLLAREQFLRDWKHPTAWGAFHALWLSAYRMTTRDELYEDARVAPILVLDDLGGEESTGRARGRVCEVLSERYNQCRITIITTNISVTEMSKIYGQRVAERVFGDGLGVCCTGDSLRMSA